MSATRIAFSKDRLTALPLPEGGKRATYHDTKIPGLQLRVSTTGVKTFCVYRRMKGGKPERVTLGRFPAMTVEQARKQATAINAEIEAGANPAAVRRAVREEPTFAEALADMLAHKTKRDGSPITERTKKDYLDTARLHMVAIASSKLSRITRSEVKAIHTKVSKKSARQADKAVAIISSVFNYAADCEHFKGENPAVRIKKNAVVTRDRFAQAAELPYLFAAIGESSLSDFFLLALLTGARRSNVQAMAWRDLDLDGGIWRIGMTKNGTPQNVTLSPEAVAALRARKGTTTGTSPFVFPGEGKTSHLVEPKKAWAAVLLRASLRRLLDHLEGLGKLTTEERQQANQQITESPAAAAKRYQAIAAALEIDPALYDMTDLRIHDLRRTLGSWQAKTGASMAIIGKSLNHKSHQATAIYARLDLDPVRQSVETATQAMLEAAKVKPNKI
ncbi:tyrosine-type recombinase/integrase [Pseudomonas sp. AN-1]|uniref:tyrosine-type recombinase/integrase n=1 Tax=Pseudomonas sp. AN-1 TaxID=3096605 RepID=UPI002A69B095|nr:tyrosine-type recombinase/integrase [Pseudomonas sp. AN-1]WPP44223.1 tyrosine-type recombinase/integrase [Pseudomonas sp. AN-1]